MIHPKAPERIRIDALRRGAEKQLAGCVTCAEEYFTLARRHGASEEEIRSALSEARRTNEQFIVSRREFLKVAAASAVGVAAASATSGLLPQMVPDSAAAAVDSAQIAWIWALRAPLPAKGEPETRLIGVSPTGSVVGQIEPLRGQPLRAPDGASLIVPWSR